MRSSTFVAMDFVSNGSFFLQIVVENHRISGTSLGRGATDPRSVEHFLGSPKYFWSRKFVSLILFQD